VNSELCPICLSVDGTKLIQSGSAGNGQGDHFFECECCGLFILSREADEDYLGPERKKTTPAARAALSHWLKRQEVTSDTLRVYSDLVVDAIERRLPLPNPSQLATNIIRYIGDATKDTGQPLDTFDPSFRVEVGSLNRRFAFKIVSELRDKGLLNALIPPEYGGASPQDIELTLAGWDVYAAERLGKTAGSYGFLALKFGDDILDAFIRLHAKPAAETLGFKLEDMRDRARAGVIDDLMRIDIRDAAFVIADLSHDNPGAYWEAGYAEGLGKPVLYICEKSKFEEFKTHFDTNHSTTVLWDANEPETFKEQFIATLRRSLVL
jgi:hypothetical protein